MSEFLCPICGKMLPILYPKRHRCPPQWRVWWWEEAETIYDHDDARIVYAEDEKEAAAKYCEGDPGLNNWTTKLMIERIDTGEWFKVRAEATIVWYGANSERVNAPMPEDAEPDA